MAYKESTTKGEFKGKSEQELIRLADEHISRVQNERREWEIKSYVNLMMKEGHHYINDRGRPDIRDPNQLRRIINKFRSTLRSLKSSVTYNDPIVDVIPERGAEAIDKEDLELASYICTDEFRKNNMKDVLRTLVEDAALKSFGCMSVLPNTERESVDDPIVKIQIYDPLDTFFDNQNAEKAQMFVVSSAENKKRLVAMGYDTENVGKGVSRKSHSALKSEFERMEGGNEKEMDMILVDQVFLMCYEEYEDSVKDKPKEGSKPVVVWFVKSGQTILKKPEILEDYRDLGDIFFLYYMEKSEHIRYPSPWATDCVPLQRSLNEASENMDTLSQWYSKVRLLQKMGESDYTQMFEDKHVQIIKYEGQKPEFATPPSIPPELFSIVDRRQMQIEDAMGMHAASMGKSVSSGASGRLQALAQAGDMDNVSEPVSNLQTFLERVFRRVIEIASDTVDEPMRFYGSGEEGKSFLAIGEDAYQALTDEGKQKTRPIKKFQNIKTTVIPGSMFMVQQSKQEVLEMLPILVNAGLKEEAKAMFDVMLRLFAPGGTRDIAKALEVKTQEIEEQNADIKIIQFEIVKLARGEPVTATPEQPHEMHAMLKTAALQKILERFSEDDPAAAQVAQNFQQNIAQHTSMMQAPPTDTSGAAEPLPAEVLSAGGGPRPLAPAPQAPLGGSPPTTQIRINR